MSNPQATSSLAPSVPNLAVRLSIYSSILFILSLGSLHLLNPALDPTWRFISEYALGPYGWIMHLAFILLAASLAGTGVVIHQQIRSKLSYIGLALLGISVIGMLMAAVFVTDPITVSAEDATFSGQMHVTGAALDLTPIASLLLSFALIRNEAWKPIRKRLFLTSGIILLAMAAFMLQIPQDGTFGPEVYAGLFGRILILSYFGWILTVALHARKLRNLHNV